MTDDPQDVAEATDADRLEVGDDVAGSDDHDPLEGPDGVGHLGHDAGDAEATAWRDEDADQELSAEEAAVHLTTDPPFGPADDGYLENR